VLGLDDQEEFLSRCRAPDPLAETRELTSRGEMREIATTLELGERKRDPAALTKVIDEDRGGTAHAPGWRGGFRFHFHNVPL